MNIHVGLVQMRAEKGGIAENLAQTLHEIEVAADRGIDILAFPEASLTGYADPVTRPEAALALDSPPIQTLLARTRGLPLTALVGIVESVPSGKPCLTQLVIRDGALLGIQRKMTLPEDDDWYDLGDAVSVFVHNTPTGALRFGVAICADISNEDVFAAAARQGARIVFEVAAPGLYGEQATRNWQTGFQWWANECETYLPVYAKTYDLWVAVATQAGRTIDEDFPGGGYVFAPHAGGAHRLYATPNGSPGAVYLNLGLAAGNVTEL